MVRKNIANSSSERGESQFALIAVALIASVIVALFFMLQSWIFNYKEDKVKRRRQHHLEQFKSEPKKERAPKGTTIRY
ncbi:MAG: hypothetical protein ACOX2O_03185 [Bdellovibrionota bacterium]|jgi:hypothetical protein